MDTYYIFFKFQFYFRILLTKRWICFCLYLSVQFHEFRLKKELHYSFAVTLTDRTVKETNETWCRTLAAWSRRLAWLSLGFKPCPSSGPQWVALWSCRRCPGVWPRTAATMWRWGVRPACSPKRKSNCFPWGVQICPANTESRAASPGARAPVSTPAWASLWLWSTWCQSTRGNTCASFAPPWGCITTRARSRCKVGSSGSRLNSGLVVAK